MEINPLAGKPAQPIMLVNVPRLVTAYYSNLHDAALAGQRVALGTPGHRGSAFENSFNEWHVLAISQAICDYHRQQGIDGPLFLGACRTLVVDSENRPRRVHFLPDSPPHSHSMGQEAGEKGAVAAGLQPTIPKSDRLLGIDSHALSEPAYSSAIEVLSAKYAESFRGADHLRRIQEEVQTIVNEALAAPSQQPGMH